MSDQIIVTILEDGTVKVDASKLEGSEAEILSHLDALAKILGGDFQVEKHVHYHHIHGDHTHHVKG